MPRKIIPILTGIFLFFGCTIAQASVIINEVQLNPTEERFIELYNSGDSVVDLTNWYIQRKTQTGSSFGSLVSKTHFESKTINANSYFLISKSAMDNADIILDNLTLTESNTIQLKNSDQEIVDKIGWGSASDCDGTCAPNPIVGESIQKIGSSWTVSSPTPKAENQISQTNSTDNNTTDDSATSSDNYVAGNADSSDSTITAKTKTTETSKIKTKISTKTFSFMGIPIEFSATATGYSNEPLSYGKYFWNFGDGDSKETGVNNPTKLTHIFLYEGEYTVALEYFQNNNSLNPDASDKIIIKVIKADISISSVGDEKDFFVEILNNTSYDADLSKWILAGNGKIFTLPNNTILGPKKKIILSSKITGFSVFDKNALKLLNPQGEIIFNYLPPTSKISESNTNKNIAVAKPTIETPKETPQVSSENLGAVAVKSEENISNAKDNFIYGIFGLFAFLGISASATYFIRNRNRKSVSSIPGSDFEIIDE
ncbi:MAG: lamin tail domain-containing protein [Candidatus Paceibacterota bacterium]